MRIEWVLLTACCALAPIAAPARAEVDLARAQSLAVEAGRAYEGGDFDAAVKLYGEVLQAGLDHAVIHYNLGNAYYKKGEVGHAIACYLRALRRDPRDSEARANLQQARQMLRDEALSPLALPVFLAPLHWIYDRLSMNEWGRLALVCLVAVALLGIMGQWTSRAAGARRKTTAVLASVTVVAMLMMGVHYQREEMRTSAIVIAEEVDVRSGPGSSYNLAFKVHEGLQVFVSERREKWAQIHLGGDLVGWVPEDQIETL